jgi:ATP-binding cassette, subfamily C, bacterial LapB
VDSQSNPKTKQTSETYDGLHQLWKHYIPLARKDVLLASLMINLLSLALPMLTLQIYDRIIPNQAMETMAALTIGLIVAVVLDVFLKTARAWLAAWTGARYEHRAGCIAMERVLASRLEDMEEVPAGIHIDRLTSVEPVRDFYASQASLAIVDLPFIFIFLILMAVIAGWLVLVPITLVLVGGYAALGIGQRLKGVLAERLVWDDRRFNFLIEALAGVHTVKSMSMEPLIERRYERLMQSSVETGFHVTYLSGLAQSVGSSLSQLGMIAVVGFGSLMVMNQSLSIGGLAACILLSGRSMQPVLKALSLWTKFQQVTVAEEKLADVDLMPLEGNDGDLYENIESVELIDASYAFNKKAPLVLKNINFSIRPGEIVGISGGNGSGKSTFLHVLMGRLDPSHGSFLINGRSGADFSLDCKADQIAYLPQRPILLKGTVLDNLTIDSFHN